MFAQSQDSVPPAPGWISNMQSFLSYGPFNRSKIFSSSVSLEILLMFSWTSLKRFSSSSISNNSNISKLLSISFLIDSILFTRSFKSFKLFNSSSAFARSFQKSGASVNCCFSFISSCFLEMSK